MQRERSMEQLLDLQGFAHTGELLEQLVDVVTDGFVAGHEAVVGVQPSVTGVVVAGTQVHVPAQAPFLPAHNQDHLGVGLVAHHAIDHDHAGFLQAAGQLQVFFLAEPRTQLDHRRDFLAPTGGIGQRLDDLGISATAVQGLTNGQHVRVFRSLTQQIHHGTEVLIGV